MPLVATTFDLKENMLSHWHLINKKSKFEQAIQVKFFYIIAQ